MLHNANSLNYSIFLDTRYLPELQSVPKSYEIFLNLICRTLFQQKIKAIPAGQSDLAIICEDGKLRKISGNAQFRKKTVVVFHGTLILSPTIIKEIEFFLRHPSKEPNYRKLRGHSDFLTHLPANFNLSIFYNSIMKELTHLTGDYISAPLAVEELRSIYSLAHQLAKKRYLRKDWILGETLV